MNFLELEEIITKWFIISGLKIILISAGAYLIFKFFDNGLNKFLATKQDINVENNKNIHTICSIFHSIVKFVVFSLAAMFILQALGVNIGPILAAAGVLGVAVGFGSQRLVEDVISGFIILINNQIRVGDIVQLDDKCGKVEKITLNMVVLKDDLENVHYIRNGKIGVVTNKTKGGNTCKTS